MKQGKYAKNAQLSIGKILYLAVGALLILTMLSTWMFSGLLAKYVVSDKYPDSARVASSGVGTWELQEHEAKETYENSGIYELLTDKDPVKGNEYEKVLPGVDIPKDPFIKMGLKDTELPYELYLEVTEKNLPDTVTYELTDDWIFVSKAGGVYKYKYKYAFDVGTTYSGEIKILKNDKLYVSEHYVGNGSVFSLSFDAYLIQKKS